MLENLDLDIGNMDDEELFNLMETIDYEKEGKELKKYEKEKFCAKCDTGEHIIEDYGSGIMVCGQCAGVIDIVFDLTLEQRTYADDTKGTVERCSGVTNIFLPQTSLATTISGRGMNRLKKLQQYMVMPYKEKSLYNVLKVIQTKCRSNNILKCIEDDAKILYKNISESKHETGKNRGKVIIIRGLNRKSLIGACIFYACKRKGKSKGPREIANICDLEYKDLTRGCKIFKKLMKMRYMPYDSQVAKPENFIVDYCKLLDIDKGVMEQAMTIAEHIQRLNVASMHTPVSVAIGGILVALDVKKVNGGIINKNTIAKKFNVSAVTVCKTYKQIMKYGKLLVYKELVEKVVKMAEGEKKKIVMPQKFKLMYDKVKNKKDSFKLWEGGDMIKYYNDRIKEVNSESERITSEYLKYLK